MIRFLPLKLSLVFLLVIQFGIIPIVFAQSSSVSQGNIIKKVTLTKEGADSILNIEGILDARQLSRVVIKQDRRNKSFSISLPNTLVDPETLPAPFVNFPAGSDLENIQIKEDIQEKGEDVFFVVDLVVQATKILIPELIRPIRDNQLRLRLKDFGRLQKQAQAKRTAEEKARAEKQRLQAERKQQKEQLRFQQLQKKKVVKKKAVLMTGVTQIKKSYHKPSIMQVSILNASGYAKRAYKLSVFLGNLQKRYIEETLGIKLDIINISNATDASMPRTTIYFRENYLKSALFLAKLIPGQQRIIPMPNQSERIGVDIEVYIGKDYK
ncbi:MAG: hypothetical protein COB67_07520 [SAR324 cluster bacterium]|uniref:LytR/CpsA/Psr regulator C-terminal domain-containing protein n=1 Tax=SAR324 cluster bacterium TaxID=2024889 RepID=A0A2A4T486_9DELT|nr:MAG: hypothetical protein COB67_07520 [SAR324 cluster bacterium]